MKEFITISCNDMCVEYVSNVLVFGKEKWHEKVLEMILFHWNFGQICICIGKRLNLWQI